MVAVGNSSNLVTQLDRAKTVPGCPANAGAEKHSPGLRYSEDLQECQVEQVLDRIVVLRARNSTRCPVIQVAVVATRL